MGKVSRIRFQVGSVTGYSEGGGKSTVFYVYDMLNCWQVVRVYKTAGLLRIHSRRCTLVVMVRVPPEMRARREARRLNKLWREEVGLK